MPFTVKYTTKFFFDRQRVIDRLDRRERGALSRFGAFIRRAARRLIRRTKKATSKPGQPPRSHGPEPNLRTIFFVYEERAHSVIVGPVKFNSGGGALNNNVPKTLEHGGVIGFREKRYPGGEWRPLLTTRRPRPGEQRRVRRYRIAARPFMGPALEQEADKFPDLFAARA